MHSKRDDGGEGEISGYQVVWGDGPTDREAAEQGLGKFTILGKHKDLIFKGGMSITRPPWPFFDVTGSPIIFGDQITVSSGVYILTHDHQFDKRNWKELDHIVNLEPTVIEDGVFLGINVIVLPSCKRIGKHSVIGAGSVVTKDVPDDEIWVGNPARKVGDVS